MKSAEKMMIVITINMPCQSPSIEVISHSAYSKNLLTTDFKTQITVYVFIVPKQVVKTQDTVAEISSHTSPH